MGEPDSLSTLLPRHLVERAVAGRAEIEGERKLITLLFADVVGSTALASDLDPEDVVDLLNGLFSLWVTAVHRYEGTVDKFLGDGMLAVFGAPLVHEDDPRRAVLAALEIRDATHSYAATLDGLALDVRIGLNTGTVVVGAIGSDARMEYTVIGDPVNVAQRIEASAAPGTIFIGEATRRLVEPYFSLRNAGAHPLKGKAEPAILYEVIGDAGITGTVRGIRGMTSPLVGRSRELGRLEESLHDLRSGTGSVLALVGEPGLGKSRLLAEVRDRASDLLWAEGHAISFGAATPYLPLAQLIAALDPEPADPDLETLVRGGTIVDPDGARDRLVAAIRRLVIERAPVVLAVEDLHWADDATVDALEILATTARSHPIALLITSRPEGRDRLAALGAETIPIERLDDDAHVQLLTNLLRIDRVPVSLQQLVIERSQGNPLFTEEFLRMLIADGVLHQQGGEWAATGPISELSVPPTLHGLVASRIDRLDAGSRKTLQAASVLGPAFDEPLLLRLVDPPARLAPLHAGGFLLPGPTPGSHLFKHVITQEVAYSEMLKKTRRVLHRRAGEAIEELYPEETGKRAAELGRHFDLAGDPDRAVPYLSTAAHRSFAAFSNEAALESSERALELTDDAPLRFDLWELRTRILGHIGRHDEEWETVQMMETIAGPDERLQLRALEAAVRCRLGSEYLEAYALCQRALDLADRVSDAALRGRILVMWAELERRQYSPARAIPALEEAIELFAAAGQGRYRALALNELAGILALVDPPRASRVVTEALEAARQTGDPQLHAAALLRSGHDRTYGSDPASAHADLDQAIAIANEIGDRALLLRAHLMAGQASVLTEDAAGADRHFFEAMETAHRIDDAYGWLSGAMNLVETWETQERFVDLYQWLTGIEPEVATWDQPHNRSYVHYALGYRTLRWLNRPAEASEHLARALQLIEDTSSPDWRPPAVMFRNGMAAIQTDLGRLDDARTLLDEARAIAAEHQLEEVTLAYLLVTEARLSMREGDLERAGATVAELRAFAGDESPSGTRHAADVLSAELALAESRPADALAFARAALESEPLRADTRSFSRLRVLDLLARATAASGGDPGSVWAEARSRVDAFLAGIPDEFVESLRRRPDIESILQATS